MTIVSDKPAATPTYARVGQTNWRYLKTIALAVCSAGLYLYYQSCQLQKALQCGKMNDAEDAIRKGGWWIYQYTIGSDDIRRLAFTNQVESIKLIAAQILFDPKLVNGGSNAANALIEARDIKVPDYEKLNVLKRILPESSHPRTIVDLERAAITRDAERIFADQVKEPESDRLSEQYLEYIFNECREDPKCSVETYINAIYDRFPLWREDPDHAPIPKKDLTAYYSKRIRLPYSALVNFGKITTLI